MGDFSAFLASGLIVSTCGIRGRCPRLHGPTHVPSAAPLAGSPGHGTNPTFGPLVALPAPHWPSLPVSLVSSPQGPRDVIGVF